MDRRLWRAPLVVVLVGLMMAAGLWQWVRTSSSARAEARLAGELDLAAGWVGAVLDALRGELDDVERDVPAAALQSQGAFAARLQPLVDSGAVPGLEAALFVEPVPVGGAPTLVAAGGSGTATESGAAAPVPSGGAGERWLVQYQVSGSEVAGARPAAALGLDLPAWDLAPTATVREAFDRARVDGRQLATAVVDAAALASMAPAGAGGPAGRDGERWLLTRWSDGAGGWVVGVLDPMALLAHLPGLVGERAALLANARPVDLEDAGAATWRPLDVPGTVTGPGAEPFVLAAGPPPARNSSADTVAVACLLLTALSAVTVSVLAWSQRRLAASRSRSLVDGLTGLANRPAAEAELARLVTGGLRPAVLFADIDRFKLINDALGHQAGDEVLRAVGRAIAQACPLGALPARWGGDEFVVVCPGGTGEALETAERVLEVVGGPVAVRGGRVAVGVSVGLADAAPGGQFESTLAAADAAMYEAKRQGGGRVRVAGGDDAAAARALRRALAGGEVTVELEPVVSCSPVEPVGRVVGYVARRTWGDGPGGALSEDELSDHATRLDLGVALLESTLAVVGRAFEVGLVGPASGLGPAAVRGAEAPPAPVGVVVPVPDAVVLDPGLGPALDRWAAAAPAWEQVGLGVSELALTGGGVRAGGFEGFGSGRLELHVEGFDGRTASLAALAGAAPAGLTLASGLLADLMGRSPVDCERCRPPLAGSGRPSRPWAPAREPAQLVGSPRATLLDDGPRAVTGGAAGGPEAAAARLVRAVAAWGAAAGVPLTAVVACPCEASLAASSGVTRVRGPVAGPVLPLDVVAGPAR